MAMTRQLWTLNGLATELGKDRRTLGRALRHVQPMAQHEADTKAGSWRRRYVL